MAHEKSITVQNAKGQWVNIPTIYKGKPVTDAKALALHNQGFLPALDRGKTYKTEPPAAARAAKRSFQTPENHSKRGIRPPGARR